MGLVGTFSRGIARNPAVPDIVGADGILLAPRRADAERLMGVVGWGLKSNTQQARRYAAELGLPYFTLEDGFVRSLGLGVEGAQGLSYVVDEVGIYYDARTPSSLENMLAAAEGSELDIRLKESSPRAQNCIAEIRRAGISKYNHAPPCSLPERETNGRARVLVVDQTAGDLSIECGRVAEGGIPRMLERAYVEHPDAEIWIKAHPDVIAGRKEGHLDPRSTHLDGERVRRTRWIVEQTDSISLLNKVDSVYVATSQMGFEALLEGKPVSCFGAPYYSGWGLTDDRVESPRRGRARSLEEVFAASYLHYSRYWLPGKIGLCELEDVLEHLSVNRRLHAANEGEFYCFGFSRWKRHWARDFLQGPRSTVHFVSDLRQARRRGFGSKKPNARRVPRRVVVWGQRSSPRLESAARRAGLPLWRVEDGFLRSVGLGSDLTRASSLVVDTRGIYYDPSRPSDLEHILQTREFDRGVLERARKLIAHLVSARVSKYNTGTQVEPGLHADPRRRRILVPGQVEDDASIRFGCDRVRTNTELLAQVRRENPDAWVVYKPHPDVVAGNRVGVVDAPVERGLCDAVVIRSPIPDCLERVDAVHTMTSLVGFEGLLRGLDVVCYGAPFYSGWGLTTDRRRVGRRTRVLTLEELVAGVLIEYPRYIAEPGAGFTTPERIIDMLARAGGEAGHPLTQSRLARRLGQLARLIEGIRNA